MASQPIESPGAGRRGFLRFVIGASAAVMAAVVAIPGIGFVLAPVVSRAERRKRKVIFKNPQDARSTTFVEARYDHQEETSPGLFVRMDGGQPVVLWARCPHASCAVEWKPAEKEFLCPCHQGRFDASGKNIAGPPPRPLERLAATVEGGNIYVEEPEA